MSDKERMGPRFFKKLGHMYTRADVSPVQECHYSNGERANGEGRKQSVLS